MRIKILGYNIFQKGGTSRSNLNLVQALVAEGYEVTYVNYISFQQHHLQSLKASDGNALAGVKVTAFRGIQSLLDTDLLIFTRESFFNMAREVKHCDARIRILGEVHGPLAYISNQTDLALEAIDVIRVSTQQIAEEFKQRYDYPYVFPMYVNTSHISWKVEPYVANKNLFMKVRFEDEVKGVSYALKLMRYAVHTRGEKALHLYLHGYGPSHSLYEKLIDYYELHEHVHINEKEPAHYIYLSASPYETLGYSILESVATGHRALIYPGKDNVLHDIYADYHAIDFIEKDLSTDFDVMMTAFSQGYSSLHQQEDQQRYASQFSNEGYGEQLVQQVMQLAKLHTIDVSDIAKPKITSKQQFWLRQCRGFLSKLKRKVSLPQKIRNNVWTQRTVRVALLAENRLKNYRQQIVRQDAIFIESFHGKNFSGDPKYIALALQRQYPNVTIFVSAQNELVEMEIRSYGMVPIRFGSRAYIRAFNQCRYVIINGNLWDKLTKQKDQQVIQTWHGFPLKRMVNDLMNPEERQRQAERFKPNMLKWDILLTVSRLYERYVTSAFDLNVHPSLRVFPYGAPRNSYLIRHRQDDKEREAVQEKYLFNKDDKKRYILFCPTWRKETRSSVSELDLVSLLERLPSHYEIIVKLHPNEGDLYQTYRAMHERIHCFDNALVDIQELYLLADILMTDYSSAMFDYAHLQRPILVLDEDTVSYGQEVGFYFDVTQLTSIHHVKPDVEKVTDIIQQIETVDHHTLIEQFMTYDTETSDDVVAKAIWQL
ncbi:CDP-glycerol--glycerophosphate glycerophosphotransferase [Staphylococcus muscae]|uniref:Glycosyl transferase family 1 n=1 Tax=Staphylococcus muscae TaxID=1294 RepID=A0A240BW85_9STAP|nr:CDP-glycerol glycerophosphotransferase family protein [Staphylococcus muscae]AVQ34273.1 CDP-glycerol--glycerophosphate glycerophosphotransferase [Staphylococcus muscae]PNZ03876.1 CDP-glycerol--glycerophosphate glycerophosphotransferase [Staphylococcus muscae]GGA84648.1 glycosyl transferase family 1 [Staphylococcus muscae]SNV99935.1 putative glycosyltransferase [Staphylococcus muscae]